MRRNSCSDSGRTPGTNYELTRQLAVRCLQVIEEEAGPGNVEISMGFAGQQAPNFGLNNMLLFMRGPDDGQLRVALREGSGIHIDEFQEQSRFCPSGSGRGSPASLVKEDCRPSRPSPARGCWFSDSDRRHRQRGHEFRLARPRRSRRCQPPIWPTHGNMPSVCGTSLTRSNGCAMSRIQQTLDYPAVPVAD